MKHSRIIFLLFISSTVFSQVPGYMGKRFVIGYSNYLFPSMVNPSFNSTDSYELGLNTTHCINAEYAIRKRTNFCFSVEFFKTGFRSIGTYDYGTSLKKLQTTNVSLGFKFFRQGFIAPVGKYQKLEFLLLSNKIYNETFESKAFAIALTFGRQHVFFNSIIVDTGFRFGVSTNAVFNIIINDVFEFHSATATYDSEQKQNINERLFAAQLFNFHIGIGFLAF